MRRFLFPALLILIALLSVAQAELISPRPHCASIRNDTGSYLFAAIRTDYGTTASGEKRRHESTFRLEAGEAKDACATGPFYPGYQVELVIKTMIPVFSCKTRLAGVISITSSRDEEGRNKISATCVPPALFR